MGKLTISVVTHVCNPSCKFLVSRQSELDLVSENSRISIPVVYFRCVVVSEDIGDIDHK